MTTLFEIEPEYRRALEAAKLAEFDAMLRAPAAGPPASRHAHRETVPLEIVVDGAPRRFFLKRVFKVPPRHAIWPLFRFRRGISQPRHEWNMLAELAECGISAAKRVVYGERRVLGVPVQALLLVEAVPFEHTLEDWLVSARSGVERLTIANRRRLIYQLGTYILTVQSGGLRGSCCWPDIHLKHIFAGDYRDDDGRCRWRFVLIDVERMFFDESRFGIKINDALVPIDEKAFSDLQTLCRSTLPEPISRSDILAFWAGYTSGLRKMVRESKKRKPYPPPDCAWLEEFLDRPRMPDGFRWDRSIVHEEVNGVVTAHCDRELLATGRIESIDDVFLSEGKNLTKPGLASYRDRIRMTLRGEDGGERVCYLKRYRNPPLAAQLRRMREHDRRDSTAKREAHFIKRLSLLGIPTMHCLAWGQEMAGPWERRSFIITEEIPGESLEKLAARAAADPSAPPSPRERHEIIRQLAIVAWQLHHNRLFHRDLYLSHVFLTRNADGGIVLRLIDLARMIEKPLMSQRWMIKDLAALDYSSPAPVVTRADRVRFLYHYLGGSNRRQSRARGSVRELAGKVRRRAAKMARHDARREKGVSG